MFNSKKNLEFKSLILKNKNILVIISVFFLLILLFIGWNSLLKKDGIDRKQKNRIIEYTDIFVEVDFESNLFFSKYGVRVFIDDNEIGTIEHGGFFSNKIEKIEKGKHNLRFEKSDKSSINGRVEINVEESMTYKIKIKSHSNSIEIIDYAYEKGIDNIPIIMENYVGMNLKIAYEKLKSLGIKEVKDTALEEGPALDFTNWIVVEQNVPVGKEINKGINIELKVLKTNNYLYKNLSGTNVNEAIKTLKTLNMNTIVYELSNPKKNVTELLDKMDISEKENWIVENATVESKSENIYKLIVSNKDYQDKLIADMQKEEEIRKQQQEEKEKEELLQRRGGYDYAVRKKLSGYTLYIIFDYDTGKGYYIQNEENGGYATQFNFEGTPETEFIIKYSSHTERLVVARNKKFADLFIGDFRSRYEVSDVEEAYSALKMEKGE